MTLVPPSPAPTPTGQGGATGTLTDTGTPKTPAEQVSTETAVTFAEAGPVGWTVVVRICSMPLKGPPGVTAVQPVPRLLSRARRIRKSAASAAPASAVARTAPVSNRVRRVGNGRVARRRAIGALKCIDASGSPGPPAERRCLVVRTIFPSPT